MTFGYVWIRLDTFGYVWAVETAYGKNGYVWDVFWIRLGYGMDTFFESNMSQGPQPPLQNAIGCARIHPAGCTRFCVLNERAHWAAVCARSPPAVLGAPPDVLEYPPDVLV